MSYQTRHLPIQKRLYCNHQNDGRQDERMMQAETKPATAKADINSWLLLTAYAGYVVVSLNSFRPVSLHAYAE